VTPHTSSALWRKICYSSPVKKKENLWQLLKRLDEEAGEFNMALSEANRYFDSTEKKTKKLLQKHEKDLHKTIGKVRTALKNFMKKKDRPKEKKK
jgi:hypothetical protein